MANSVPITKKDHKKITVSNERNLAHVAKQHLVPVHVREFAKVATCYPIILIKDPQSENYRTVAMLGLEADENLYYSKDLWNAIYVPQALSIYPFALGPDPKKEKTLTATIDLDSEFVGKDKENALFDKKGEETEYYKGVQDMLNSLYENQVISNRFVKELVDNDLLVELSLDVNLSNGSKKNLVGIYGIDERKLQKLSDEKVLDFNKRGLFLPIHAMLTSVGQINRLAQLRNLSDNENKVANIQFQAVEPEEKK